jgi:DNA-binding XRE family transcriptional regulator
MKRSSEASPAEKLASQKRTTPGKRPPARRRIWDCKLRELRVALDLTQRDVAAAVGLSAAGYHQIEVQGNDVCLSTCVRLAKFFGKPIEQIWVKPEASE